MTTPGMRLVWSAAASGISYLPVASSDNPGRLHDARHTHASLLLKQNAHPKIVQERLGHASVSTTLDLYSHVVPGLQEVAARRFDEALSPVYNKLVGKGEDIDAISNVH